MSSCFTVYGNGNGFILFCFVGDDDDDNDDDDDDELGAESAGPGFFSLGVSTVGTISAAAFPTCLSLVVGVVVVVVRAADELFNSLSHPHLEESSTTAAWPFSTAAAASCFSRSSEAAAAEEEEEEEEEAREKEEEREKERTARLGFGRSVERRRRGGGGGGGEVDEDEEEEEDEEERRKSFLHANCPSLRRHVLFWRCFRKFHVEL